MINVKSIKFLAMVPTPGHEMRNGIPYKVSVMESVETSFGLGLGPCGRYVSVLTYEVSERFLKIKQISHVSEEAAEWYRGPIGKVFILSWAEDTEIKEFIYKIEDVVGRITAIS